MVDVCLVVEGSYPYVTGGVSAWTHDLLDGLCDVSFAIAHVGHEREGEQGAVYRMPDNARLVHVALDPDRATPPAGAQDVLPEARVYHAACTGAAGELARRAAAQHGAGFALTEHGLAWREVRWGIEACKPGGRVEIAGCKPGGRFEVYGCKPGGSWGGERRLTREEAVARAEEVFAMAVVAYADADAVTSVCGPNARLQRALGAGPARTAVIPNAVAPAAPGDEPRDRAGFLVGFIGRVVAVKDVACFLRACALVAGDRADARFVVVGPTHHDPEYAQACRELAEELRIAERVTFTGETDPAPWMARLDALVLTSRSEAQPLVALEAMAAGVPVVAADVGGCREAIGDAGLMTRPGDPQATADALLRLAGDDLLRARLGAGGRRRVAARHDQRRVHGAYRELYERLAA
jgi:glycosyltransferase involved in cell wall biosynthesis